MFLLIDYRIKILIFSDISKFFSDSIPVSVPVSVPVFFHLRTVCRHTPVGPYRASSPVIRRQVSVRCKPLFGRCYLCHTDNGKEGSGQALRIIRKIRRNRLVVTSASTGRYLGIDWSISWHRLVDATESTAHFPGIDWSIPQHRLVNLGIDWSMQGMAGTRKS